MSIPQAATTVRAAPRILLSTIVVSVLDMGANAADINPALGMAITVECPTAKLEGTLTVL